MIIKFANNAPASVRIAVARYEPIICQGDWLVEGWWTLNPGDVVETVGTNSTVFYFCAYDTEGLGYTWAPPPSLPFNMWFLANVIEGQEHFSHCRSIAPPGSRSVGMRQVDTGQLMPIYIYSIHL
jgi:hypothetical protein